MGFDTLVGRFSVTKNGKVKPIAIISSSNTFIHNGNRYVNERYFIPIMNSCKELSNDEYVSKEIATKCIEEQFKTLEKERNYGTYRNIPKTKNGYVKGFFNKTIPSEEFERWSKNPLDFEKSKYKHLSS